MTAPPPVLVESTAAHTRTGRAPLRSRSANVSGKPTGMNGPASEDSYGVPAKSAHAGGARLKKNRKTAAASAAAVVQPPSSTSYVTTTRGGSAAEDDNVLPLNLEKAIRLARGVQLVESTLATFVADAEEELESPSALSAPGRAQNEASDEDDDGNSNGDDENVDLRASVGSLALSDVIAQATEVATFIHEHGCDGQDGEAEQEAEEPEAASPGVPTSALGQTLLETWHVLRAWGLKNASDTQQPRIENPLYDALVLPPSTGVSPAASPGSQPVSLSQLARAISSEVAHVVSVADDIATSAAKAKASNTSSMAIEVSNGTPSEAMRLRVENEALVSRCEGLAREYQMCKEEAMNLKRKVNDSDRLEVEVANLRAANYDLACKHRAGLQHLETVLESEASLKRTLRDQGAKLSMLEQKGIQMEQLLEENRRLHEAQVEDVKQRHADFDGMAVEEVRAEAAKKEAELSAAAKDALAAAEAAQTAKEHAAAETEAAREDEAKAREEARKVKEQAAAETEAAREDEAKAREEARKVKEQATAETEAAREEEARAREEARKVKEQAAAETEAAREEEAKAKAEAEAARMAARKAKATAEVAREAEAEAIAEAEVAREAQAHAAAEAEAARKAKAKALAEAEAARQAEEELIAANKEIAALLEENQAEASSLQEHNERLEEDLGAARDALAAARTAAAAGGNAEEQAAAAEAALATYTELLEAKEARIDDLERSRQLGKRVLDWLVNVYQRRVDSMAKNVVFLQWLRLVRTRQCEEAELARDEAVAQRQTDASAGAEREAEAAARQEAAAAASLAAIEAREGAARAELQRTCVYLDDALQKAEALQKENTKLRDERAELLVEMEKSLTLGAEFARAAERLSARVARVCQDGLSDVQGTQTKEGQTEEGDVTKESSQSEEDADQTIDTDDEQQCSASKRLATSIEDAYRFLDAAMTRAEELKSENAKLLSERDHLLSEAKRGLAIGAEMTAAVEKMKEKEVASLAQAQQDECAAASAPKTKLALERATGECRALRARAALVESASRELSAVVDGLDAEIGAADGAEPLRERVDSLRRVVEELGDAVNSDDADADVGPGSSEGDSRADDSVLVGLKAYGEEDSVDDVNAVDASPRSRVRVLERALGSRSQCRVLFARAFERIRSLKVENGMLWSTVSGQRRCVERSTERSMLDARRYAEMAQGARQMQEVTSQLAGRIEALADERSRLSSAVGEKEDEIEQLKVRVNSLEAASREAAAEAEAEAAAWTRSSSGGRTRLHDVTEQRDALKENLAAAENASAEHAVAFESARAALEEAREANLTLEAERRRLEREIEERESSVGQLLAIREEQEQQENLAPPPTPGGGMMVLDGPSDQSHLVSPASECGGASLVGVSTLPLSQQVAKYRAAAVRYREKFKKLANVHNAREAEHRDAAEKWAGETRKLRSLLESCVKNLGEANRRQADAAKALSLVQKREEDSERKLEHANEALKALKAKLWEHHGHRRRVRRLLPAAAAADTSANNSAAAAAAAAAIAAARAAAKRTSVPADVCSAAKPSRRVKSSKASGGSTSVSSKGTLAQAYRELERRERDRELAHERRKQRHWLPPGLVHSDNTGTTSSS
ncbi:hypothetical protein NFJ02_09g141140 [Pycnococcus provasolii]